MTEAQYQMGLDFEFGSGGSCARCKARRGGLRDANQSCSRCYVMPFRAEVGLLC